MVVLVRGDDEVAAWPLTTRVPPDLAVAHHLARLQLVARRVGCSIRLRNASVALIELLELVGLRQVIREAEEGEEAGVQEVVDRGDPVA